MRIGPQPLTALSFVVATVLFSVVAGGSATLIEQGSTRAVRVALETAGQSWADVEAHGLQVVLRGTAPSEARRLRAITAAGQVIDAGRIVDLTEVAAAESLAPPEFALEILRNDDGISLIGLVPASTDRGAMVTRLRGLAVGGQIADMLESADYPVPPGWERAAAFALAALSELPRSKLAGWSRLARLDRVQREVTEAARGTDMKHARRVLRDLSGLYAGRAEMAGARKRLRKRTEEVLDPDTALMLAERELMAPLDAAARLEIEAAARLVATTTALVPLALADVLTALVANLRMIRRLAELYGGRAGALGSIRLARTVLTHLVATGAVAVGDDMLGSVAGGGLVSKLSRRFGEGVVNGALTARVGVAAMEVCRPMPFVALDRPRVSNIVSRALTGLFGKEREEG